MKKLIASFLIPCLLLYFYGCSSAIYPPSDEVENLNPDDEIVIVLKDNRTIPVKKWWIQNDTLYVFDRAEAEGQKREVIRYALTDIKKITQEDHTPIIIGISIALGVAGLILLLSTAKGCDEAIKESK